MTKFVVVDGRVKKAEKMNSVVCDYLAKEKLSKMRILDIGCGTGEIISFFNKNENQVFAVDVFNQVNENFDVGTFKQVNSAILPFEDNFFDLIISNHVVEHIVDQDIHMSEIHRCLKPEGVCYYATPNWNYPVEPHHNIPFIHYFGQTLFHKILRLFNQYEEDLYLLSYREMKRSFDQHGFLNSEYTVKILKNPNEFHLNVSFTQYVPKFIFSGLKFLIPTNIFILSKKND